MSPDQTATKEKSDLCLYRLQYRLPKNIKQSFILLGEFLGGGNTRFY